MAPSVERFAARLALLPHAELLEFAAQACHDIPAFRRDADALLAIRTPVPDCAVSEVLLSPDLMPHILSSLEVGNHAAAAVCKAWNVVGKALFTKRLITRGILRPAPAPDFELLGSSFLAALPGGERMAVYASSGVHIVDKEMKLQRTPTLQSVHYSVQGLAAGDDGLYLSETSPKARLRRLDLDTFAVAAERTGGDDHFSFFELALAPGGVLFVVAERWRRDDDNDGPGTYPHELLALDARSLEVRFTVGKDVFHCTYLHGLAVGGDEVYVCSPFERVIHVLSLSGEPRRTIFSHPGCGWRIPWSLCCVADRLYLLEAEEEYELEQDEEEATMAGQRIFVLTPEGRTLQVCTSPRPIEEHVRWSGMCHFDGKLMVAKVSDYRFWRDEVLALE